MQLQITIFLNMASLLLGLCAWVFAGMAIIKKKMKVSYRCSVGSFCMCVMSLLLQLLEIKNRIVQRDFAAIEDTIGTVIFAFVVLVVGTLLLNIIAVIRHD